MVSIRFPKTRRQSVHSQVQHVLVECQNFALLLRWEQLRAAEKNWCRVLDCSANEHATAVFPNGCDPHSVTLAGFRGEATDHWLRLRNLPALRRRGRWSSEKALERYVQEGVYYLQAASVPGPPPLLRSLATLAPSIFRRCGRWSIEFDWVLVEHRQRSDSNACFTCNTKLWHGALAVGCDKFLMW